MNERLNYGCGFLTAVLVGMIIGTLILILVINGLWGGL